MHSEDLNVIDYDLSRYDRRYYEAFDGVSLPLSDTLPGKNLNQRKCLKCEATCNKYPPQKQFTSVMES